MTLHELKARTLSSDSRILMSSGLVAASVVAVSTDAVGTQRMLRATTGIGSRRTHVHG